MRKATNFMSQTVYGILTPFLGTALGAACVFFMRRQLSDVLQRILTGFRPPAPSDRNVRTA